MQIVIVTSRKKLVYYNTKIGPQFALITYMLCQYRGIICLNKCYVHVVLTYTCHVDGATVI
jgi:hypothetical protein